VGYLAQQLGEPATIAIPGFFASKTTVANTTQEHPQEGGKGGHPGRAGTGHGGQVALCRASSGCGGTLLIGLGLRPGHLMWGR